MVVLVCAAVRAARLCRRSGQARYAARRCTRSKIATSQWCCLCVSAPRQCLISAMNSFSRLLRKLLCLSQNVRIARQLLLLSSRAFFVCEFGAGAIKLPARSCQSLPAVCSVRPMARAAESTSPSWLLDNISNNFSSRGACGDRRDVRLPVMATPRGARAAATQQPRTSHHRRWLPRASRGRQKSRPRQWRATAADRQRLDRLKRACRFLKLCRNFRRFAAGGYLPPGRCHETRSFGLCGPGPGSDPSKTAVFSRYASV